MNLRYNNVTLDLTVKDFDYISMFFYNMSVTDYFFERSRMVSGGS